MSGDRGVFDLRSARINAGFSMKGLARELGVHEHAVRQLERGNRVRPATAKRVADFFEVQVTDLMPVEEAA